MCRREFDQLIWGDIERWGADLAPADTSGSRVLAEEISKWIADGEHLTAELKHEHALTPRGESNRPRARSGGRADGASGLMAKITAAGTNAPGAGAWITSSDCLIQIKGRRPYRRQQHLTARNDLRLRGGTMFSLAAFDVDNEKREVCHRASGASVAFYACPEEDWRACPGNFAMHRHLGSLDSSDIPRFDAGALAAAVTAGMKSR